MRFSWTMAVVIGGLLPVAETVRRWNTWRQDPMAMFDDYLLGAILLLSAWYAARAPHKRQLVLTAVWGFMCGIGFLGLLGQFRRLHVGEPDPAPISSEWVAVLKGLGLALAVVALLATINAKRGAVGSPLAAARDA